MRGLRWGWAWGIAGLLLLPLAAGAEIRQLETTGAFPLRPGERYTLPPRDAAVRLALNEAVRRVALDLVPDLSPDEAAEYLPDVLGEEPLDYTSRFRITEDRGEVTVEAATGAGEGLAYVVVVEAHIDADRVAERLEGSGLIFGRADGLPANLLRVVVEELDDYSAYAALRNLLEDSVDVDSALPVEVERGRSELRVETRLGAEQLLEELLAAAPPEVQITPLEVAADSIRLRVALVAPVEPADAEPAAGDRRRD